MPVVFAPSVSASFLFFAGEKVPSVYSCHTLINLVKVLKHSLALKIIKKVNIFRSDYKVCVCEIKIWLTVGT